MFRLIACIDRINYLSDVFINYYKQIFNNEEFFFMIDRRNYDAIKKYLDERIPGYGSIMINKTNIGHGISDIQNRIKDAAIDEGCTVIYADIDELIYHPNLKQYIQDCGKEIIIAQGVVLFQHPSEGPLDRTKKILDQRNYCKLSHHFSKVCILKNKFQWTAGRHNRPPGVPNDPNVFLIDISKMCNKLIEENNAVNREMYKSGATQRYSTPSAQKVLNEWSQFIPEKMQEIPEIIKQCSCF